MRVFAVDSGRVEPRQYFSKSRDAPRTRPWHSAHLPECAPSSGGNSFECRDLRRPGPPHPPKSPRLPLYRCTVPSAAAIFQLAQREPNLPPQTCPSRAPSHGQSASRTQRWRVGLAGAPGRAPCSDCLWAACCSSHRRTRPRCRRRSTRRPPKPCNTAPSGFVAAVATTSGVRTRRWPPARRSAEADNDARRQASHPFTRLCPTAQLQGQWRCDVAQPRTRPPALPR